MYVLGGKTKRRIPNVEYPTSNLMLGIFSDRVLWLSKLPQNIFMFNEAIQGIFEQQHRVGKAWNCNLKGIKPLSFLYETRANNFSESKIFKR